MDRLNIKKRGRGRPKATNGVTVHPIWHKEPDFGAISRAFIELSLELARKSPQVAEKTGLPGDSKVECKGPL